jgi:hypothetical protein
VGGRKVGLRKLRSEGAAWVRCALLRPCGEARKVCAELVVVGFSEQCTEALAPRRFRVLSAYGAYVTKKGSAPDTRKEVTSVLQGRRYRKVLSVKVHRALEVDVALAY